MLARQFEWLPVRPRGLVVSYARPQLTAWKFPLDVEAQLEHEDQFGMLTTIACGGCGKYTGRWAAVGSESFLHSGVHEWFATTLSEPCVFVGITMRSRPWVHSAGDHEGFCIEPFFVDGIGIGLKEMTFDGEFVRHIKSSTPAAASCLTAFFLPNRRVRFTVDLQNNLFTVSFGPYSVHAVIPNLASFRPFFYFFPSSLDRSKVSFS